MVQTIELNNTDFKGNNEIFQITGKQNSRHKVGDLYSLLPLNINGEVFTHIMELCNKKYNNLPALSMEWKVVESQANKK